MTGRHRGERRPAEQDVSCHEASPGTGRSRRPASRAPSRWWAPTKVHVTHAHAGIAVVDARVGPPRTPRCCTAADPRASRACPGSSTAPRCADTVRRGVDHEGQSGRGAEFCAARTPPVTSCGRSGRPATRIGAEPGRSTPRHREGSRRSPTLRRSHGAVSCARAMPKRVSDPSPRIPPCPKRSPWRCRRRWRQRRG